jgi:hypothetical protein
LEPPVISDRLYSVDDLSLVRDHTALSVVVGSRAYGLATDASDVDRRGLHLMPIEADLTRLGEGPAYLPELIAAKRAAEHGALPVGAPDRERLTADVAAMTARLERDRDRSSLPERPSAEPALHDLLVRARLGRRPHVNSRSQG